MNIDRVWSFNNPYQKIWQLMSILAFENQYQPDSVPLRVNYYKIDWDNIEDQYKPNLNETREIVFFLQQIGALSVVDEVEIFNGRRTYPVGWNVKINRTRFEHVMNEVAELAGIINIWNPEATKDARKDSFVNIPSEPRPEPTRGRETDSKESKKFCWMENNNFHILRNDGTEGIMKFTDETGKKDMLNLFGVIYSYWLEEGKEEDGWIKVVMSQGEIRKCLKAKGLDDVTNDWISDTINNIRKNKITSDVKGYVLFDYFDRKLQGFPFRIKRSSL